MGLIVGIGIMVVLAIIAYLFISGASKNYSLSERTVSDNEEAKYFEKRDGKKDVLEQEVSSNTD
ncbi:MAG: hypothetical protein WAX22_02760 [Lactococcus hircilactis]|uniref:hypothetical protein n=1 Tax=Lactococcus hircilactis TaxID=1494462 RepID=UPI003BE94B72